MASTSRYIAGFAVVRRGFALLALFALFLQGSSGGHMLLVEHTRCAEHGELVHGEPQQGELAHRHVETGHEKTERPSLHHDLPASADEAHGHCAPYADRRDGLAEVDANRALIVLARVSEPLFTRDTHHVPQPKRFRIAPKNSPPA